MSLTVRFKDIGFCGEGSVQAETEDDLLQQIAEHAQSIHGLETVTDKIITRINQ